MKPSILRNLALSVPLLCMTVPIGADRGQGEPIATTGGPRVPIAGCFYYEHDSFRGARRDLPIGLRRRYVGDDWNDQISSIACAPGCGLKVYEHRDFGGYSKVFRGKMVYVGDAWNDDISSLEVVNSGGCRAE